METNSSKLNGIVLYFLDLIVLGCVFICFGTGITTNSSVYAKHASIFDLTFGNYAVLPMTIIFFLLLLGVVLVGVAGTLLLMGKKAAPVLTIISGIEVFAVGMLYFFTWAFVSTATKSSCGLNVASIFNGVLLVLSGIITFFVGLASKAAPLQVAE